MRLSAQAEFRRAADDLRNLAGQETAVKEGLVDRLASISDKLERATSLSRSSDDHLWSDVDAAVSEAAQLKVEYTDPAPLSENNEREIDQTIQQAAHELLDLQRRANDMADAGNFRTLRTEASRIGRQLLIAGHYAVRGRSVTFPKRLREIANELHRLETGAIDGSESFQGRGKPDSGSWKVARDVQKLNGCLQKLLSLE